MFTDTRLFVLMLHFVLYSVTHGIFNKTRLCVQHEINDYNSSASPLQTINRTSRGRCFMECVRHQYTNSSCRAFQFQSKYGFCELLPDVTCMAENVTPGISFIGLSECRFAAPRQQAVPEDGNWQWVTDPPTMDGTITERSPSGGWRYVTRVLHQGLYLPGSTKGGRFQSAGPSRAPFSCNSNIQYLTFEDPSHFKWEPFNAGDAIPSTAIMGGYWPGYTPLYILRVIAPPRNAIYFVYYNEETLEVLPKTDGIIEMAILVNTF